MLNECALAPVSTSAYTSFRVAQKKNSIHFCSQRRFSTIECLRQEDVHLLLDYQLRFSIRLPFSAQDVANTRWDESVLPQEPTQWEIPLTDSKMSCFIARALLLYNPDDTIHLQLTLRAPDQSELLARAVATLFKEFSHWSSD